MSSNHKNGIVRTLSKVLDTRFAYADKMGMLRHLAAVQACALLEDLDELPADTLPQALEYRLGKLTEAVKAFLAADAEGKEA